MCVFFNLPSFFKYIFSCLLYNFFLGDEDFEESYAEEFSHEPILEPKETYNLRPLPFRIGTVAFLGEDDIGLEDLPSDSDEDAGGLYDSEGEEVSA